MGGIRRTVQVAQELERNKSKANRRVAGVDHARDLLHYSSANTA